MFLVRGGFPLKGEEFGCRTEIDTEEVLHLKILGFDVQL